jgi:hypothetical protein
MKKTKTLRAIKVKGPNKKPNKGFLKKKFTVIGFIALITSLINKLNKKKKKRT